MFTCLTDPVIHDFEGEVAYSAHWLDDFGPNSSETGFVGCLLVEENEAPPEPLGHFPFWFPSTWDDRYRENW